MKNCLLNGVLTVTVASLLSGCSAGLAPSRPFDPAYFIGAGSDETSANGLEFAAGEVVVADTETREMTVRLVRFERDSETGVTSLIASDETATVPATFTEYGDFDATITFKGETLTFDGRVATLPSGQRIWSYPNYFMTHSGTGALYAYRQLDPEVEDAMDMEGFYAIGFETDPAVISARSGNLRYVGSYFGFAQVRDADGAMVDADMRTNGALTLEADFSANQVSGRLEGNLDPPDADDPEGTPWAEYELIFLGAPIDGNGFVGVADMTCPAGHTCSSDTSVGGAFYGPSGEEITGVIALDETVTGPDGYSFIGTAGFSTTSEAPE